MGHWGMGHGVWGMGHWAWGMGHGAEGKNSSPLFLCSLAPHLPISPSPHCPIETPED